jgi:hypothetical protein
MLNDEWLYVVGEWLIFFDYKCYIEFASKKLQLFVQININICSIILLQQ